MKTLVVLILFLFATGPVCATDWPLWGRTSERNMAAPRVELPETFHPGHMDYDTEVVDMATTKNVRWVFKLGSQSYGNTTVSDGRVFIGTNNESPRDPKHQGDRGVVMCLDEKSGEFLWQFVVPKLGVGKVGDWEYLGICSSPAVVGDEVFVVTNRCEVACLDVDGLADGNDGPFQDEGQYMAGPGKPAMTPGKTDADILWVYNMIEELNVFPHNITSSSVLVVGDKIFVTTSNGQDWSHVNIPNPRAPTLICLDRKTGKLIGEEASGISKRLYHCNWSSPSLAKVNGKDLVLFGAGDGYLYGFGTEPEMDEDGFGILPEVFRFNCIPREYLFDESGKKRRYPSFKGPSEIIATPVVYRNRAYVAIGQDPEHGEGVGALSCIDITKTGDISTKGLIWQFKDVERTISTCSIADGLLYIADYTGRIFCLDAETGKQYWMYDAESSIWASTLVADGKVYIGIEGGQLLVFAAEKTLKKLGEIDMEAPIYSSAIAANDTLYVASQTHLYAVGTK